MSESKTEPTLEIPSVAECENQIAYHEAQLAKYRRLRKALEKFHADDAAGKDGDK